MANIATRNRSALSPFTTFDDLDRLMDSMLGNLRLTLRPEGQSALPQAFIPKVDITETDSTIEVAADLPGLERDDVILDITDNILTLQGEKKEETREESTNRTVYRMERISGSFLRRITLPAEVEADQAEATFRNGVLRVTLPKAASSKPRQITIKAE